MKSHRILAACIASVAVCVPTATASFADSSHTSCQPYVDTNAPPANFNPLTASNADLRCYGFAPRPMNVQHLAAWTTAMEDYRYYVPTDPRRVKGHTWPSQSGAGTTTSSLTGSIKYSSNWAGYYDQADQSQIGDGTVQWIEASGTWTVPYAENHNAGAEVAAWIGLGGAFDGSGHIIQGGSKTVNQVAPVYELWWQDTPVNWFPVDAVPISGGQTVFLDIYYNSNLTTSYWYENENTGVSTSFTKGTSYVDLTTDEYMVEEFPSTYVNFGNVYFASCYSTGRLSNGSTVEGGIGTFVNRPAYMTSNALSTGTPEAKPGAINGTLDGFTVSAQNGV